MHKRRKRKVKKKIRPKAETCKERRDGRGYKKIDKDTKEDIKLKKEEINKEEL